MTSNAGSNLNENLLGFGKTQAQASKEKCLKALEEFLRPEFIARVDEVVVFSPLSYDSLVKISAIMLDELTDALSDKGITLKYDNNVCEYLAEKCQGGKRGARDLRNTIRREIEDKIVNLIVENGDGIIKEISVSYKENIEINLKLV